MGKEVADRLRLVCAKGKYLQEVRMNLPKEIVVDDDIGKMVAGAAAFSGTFAPNCKSEIYIERSDRE